MLSKVLIYVSLLCFAWLLQKLLVPRYDAVIGRCSRVIGENEVVIDNELYDTDAYARSWWSETGDDLATLQLLNAARVPYFIRHLLQDHALNVAAGAGAGPLLVLDVGCGGGVCSEAVVAQSAELVRQRRLSRPIHVLGVDISTQSLAAARDHARAQGLPVLHEGLTGTQALDQLRGSPAAASLAYVEASAYELPVPDASVDGVICSDVLEHLLDLPRALAEISRVLKPGGVFVFDTINRTPLSHAVAIVLAQEWLGIVPPRTHDWRLFVEPDELDEVLRTVHGFNTTAARAQWTGMRPSLTPWKAHHGLIPGLLSDFVETFSLDVNYLGWAVKRDERKAQTE